MEALSNSDHKIGSKYGVVWLENSSGNVRGYPCVRVMSDENVADVVAAVQNWHPESNGWTLHLEHINLQRWYHGLSAVTKEGMPKGNPKRVSRLSSDEQASV